MTGRLRFAARHFIACTWRSSAAPFHEFVEGLEIRARLAISKKLCRLQSREVFRYGRRDELIYACPVFFALSLHRSLQRTWQPQRVCHRLSHLLTLLMASRGTITSIPNRSGISPKSRALNVTNASACPLTAVSSTISSPGSRNCGRHRKCALTGSAIANTASRNISTSRSFSPAASCRISNDKVISTSLTRNK